MPKFENNSVCAENSLANVFKKQLEKQTNNMYAGIEIKYLEEHFKLVSPKKSRQPPSD